MISSSLHLKVPIFGLLVAFLYRDWRTYFSTISINTPINWEKRSSDSIEGANINVAIQQHVVGNTTRSSGKIIM